MVFFGRFVSVLRTYAAFLAGTSKMRWRLFLLANAAGGIVWAGVYTLASCLAGAALQRVSSTIAWVLAGAAVIAIVAAVLLARRQASRLAVRAEASATDLRLAVHAPLGHHAGVWLRSGPLSPLLDADEHTAVHGEANRLNQRGAELKPGGQVA